MKNNKKIIALTISTLLLLIFGSFLLPMTKATETYTTTEEIEDFSCIDDTYFFIFDFFGLSFGTSPLLYVGYGVDEQYVALFKFNLTNKPENCIKVEIILTFRDYSGYNLILPILIHNNSWNEEMTYEDFTELGEPFEPTILPFSPNYNTIDLGIGFINVFYSIDITEYSEQDFLSLGLSCLSIYSSLLEDIYSVYSKEYLVEAVRPKIVWTVEHEIVIPQNNEILFLVIGLSIGLIVGLVAVGVVIVLNKRKSKF